MPDYHEIHSRWNYLFPSKQTKTCFFVTFGIKVNYLQYQEVPYVPMCFNLSMSNCSLTFRWESWEQLFFQFFFFIFRKKAFSTVASTFFLIESAIHKNLLHYKSCPLKNLSRRKSWEIFALSIKKKNFFSWYPYKMANLIYESIFNQLRLSLIIFLRSDHHDFLITKISFPRDFSRWTLVPRYGH